MKPGLIVYELILIVWRSRPDRRVISPETEGPV
jgi:hypothetical protein